MAIEYDELDESLEALIEDMRDVLAPEFAEMSADDIVVALEEMGYSPEDVAEFFGAIKKFAKKAAPFVRRALPGVIAGASGGAALGPVGAIGGALAGGLTGALGGQGGRGRPARRGGRMRPRRAGRRPGRSGARRMGSRPGRQMRPGSRAAAQLLRVVNRPDVLRGLSSMALGQAGRRSVPVGGTPVPVGAIANLIGTLANQAAAEHHEVAGAESAAPPLYLLDDAGEFVCDPADSVERAEVLLWHMDESDDDELEVEDDEDEFDDEIENWIEIIDEDEADDEVFVFTD